MLYRSKLSIMTVSWGCYAPPPDPMEGAGDRVDAAIDNYLSIYYLSFVMYRGGRGGGDLRT